ncbi:MAG TPA: lipid-A-disaccharide synthase, partial [Planctomycetaceae bacterium]|nr:lipid-A-disaccharide synthase [Planctomycetaceae bacterium]
DVRCVGFGGPAMQAAGCDLHFRLTDMAVMGIFAVIPLLWKFFQLARQAQRYFAQNRPDAVVLIDFPGFNWWIAKFAKRAGVRVIYYLPPQMWAWADWRIEKIRRYVDDVVCGLPFEPAWYAQRGVQVEYVGHPFFDEVAEHPLDETFIESWTSQKHRNVAILPGSRNQEVQRNFPIMIEVMKRLHERHPNVRFLVACFQETHRRRCSSLLLATAARLPVHLFVGKTPEVIQVSECCSMVSGSVSLEVLARGKPAVVQYSSDWLMYMIGRMLVKCRFMTLPNLFVDREVLPEFFIVGSPAKSITRITEVLHGWLSVQDRLNAARQEVEQLRSEFAQTGATRRTADYLLQRLAPAETVPPASKAA